MPEQVINIVEIKNLKQLLVKNPNASIPLYNPDSGKVERILVADLVGGETIKVPWVIDQNYMIDEIAEFNNKIWKSLQDNNVGHQPYDDQTWWVEVSASSANGTALQPWAAGIFNIVNSSVTVNNVGYLLNNSVTLPFNSTDFATELAANIWLPMGGGGGGHIIADSDEQFPQQPILKFTGAVNVTNGTGETIVEVTAQSITVDATPTDGSTNPVASNGVFDALALKLETSQYDVEQIPVTTALQTNKLLKVNATGDGVDYTDFNADSVLQTDAIDYSSPAWMVGESRLLLTTKVSSIEGNFEGAAELMDLILPPAVLATLESSDANWVNETKTVTGDNSTYALGRTGQFGWLSDRTFVQCTFATYAVSGSATFNRNRAVDALNIADTQDLAVIKLLEPSRTGGTNDDGWNLVTQTKVITTVACKVGTYWVGGTNGSGNWFTCFAQSGTSYYWKRLGTPDSVQRPITTVSHPTLTGRLLAKSDWATSLYTVQAGDETSYQDQTFWDTAMRAYFVKVTTTQWEKIK